MFDTFKDYIFHVNHWEVDRDHYIKSCFDFLNSCITKSQDQYFRINDLASIGLTISVKNIKKKVLTEDNGNYILALGLQKCIIEFLYFLMMLKDCTTLGKSSFEISYFLPSFFQVFRADDFEVLMSKKSKLPFLTLNGRHPCAQGWGSNSYFCI